MADFLDALRDPQFRADYLQGLKDAGNRGAAAFFGGPVDMATMVARPFGYGTPDRDVVGSSEWIGRKMEERGMVSEARNPVAEFLASIAMPGAATAAGPKLYAGAQALSRAGKQMASNAMVPRTMNPQTGAIVWHGSPHKFDKFDASKIGTGEGAQAYGHGLYLAENPGVADSYAKALAISKDPLLAYEGIPKSPARDYALTMLSKNGGDKGSAIRALDNVINNPQMFRDSHVDLSTKARGIINDVDPTKIQELGGQNLYKVDLPDEHIAKMLDWDKPLSQQHPDVQAALSGPQVMSAVKRLKQSGQLGDYSADDLLKLKGEDWYDILRQANGDRNDAPSAFLKSRGIPGIRYLDGGSRGEGAGTSNYVIFPGGEDYLKILERNSEILGR